MKSYSKLMHPGVVRIVPKYCSYKPSTVKIVGVHENILRMHVWIGIVHTASPS